MPEYGLLNASTFELPGGTLLLKGVRETGVAASSSYLQGAIDAHLIYVVDPDAEPVQPDTDEVQVTGIVTYGDGDPAVIDFTDTTAWTEVDGVFTPSAHASSARVVDGGNLGATPALTVGPTDSEVWLKGTLSANATLTITGLTAGQKVLLALTQNAATAKTVTINDGSGAVAIPLSSAAQVLSARVLLECFYDGTDLLVKEI